MATPDFSVNRPGQDLQSGSARALFPIQFSAEVIATFELENVFMPLHRVRTIPNGKQAQFPVLGTTVAQKHTPGTLVLGTPVSSTQRTIYVDDLIEADVSIANFDELMNHYDIRGPYAAELGRALANLFDARVGKTIARAARGGQNNTTGASQGAIISGTGTDAKRVFNGSTGAITGGTSFQTGTLTADSLMGCFFNGVQQLDVVNAPKAQRYAAMAPAEYYLLIKAPVYNTAAVNANPLNNQTGGAGSVADGSLPRIAGVPIVVTNNMPNALDTASTAANTGGNSYAGDFSKTKCLIWQYEAVGTVKLADIATEMEYSAGRQATLIISKYVMGTNVLRPECAVEITTGAITTQAQMLL